MNKPLIVLAILTLFISSDVMSHGGRTNSAGCHNDKKNGGYHCHGTAAKSHTSSTYDSPTKTRPVVSSSSTSSVPINSELILQIQRYLNLLGYTAGQADGVLGTKTIQAIKAFQISTGEEANGLPTHSLLERLKRAANG
jgi:hypothetical protein